MDPDTEAEKEARRKIQFSVPSPVPTQLDPRQVEMVRERKCVAYIDDDGGGAWCMCGGLRSNLGHLPKHVWSPKSNITF